jgi:GNAT superfamily N-acetyltransferase
MPDLNAQQFKQPEMLGGQAYTYPNDPNSKSMDRMLDAKADPSPHLWKEGPSPSQMALPGMEQHAHPGAVHLAQGYRFETSGEYPMIVAKKGDEKAGYLSWRGHDDRGSSAAEKGPRPAGEITMVKTEPEHQRKGLASAMYGMGRQLATQPPEHSTIRTPKGDKWAKAVTKKHGGSVPPQARIRATVGKPLPAW